MSRTVIAPVIRAIHQAHPETEFDLIKLFDVETAVAALRSGAIDATFRAVAMPGRPIPEGTAGVRVLDEPLHLLTVAPRQPPLRPALCATTSPPRRPATTAPAHGRRTGCPGDVTRDRRGRPDYARLLRSPPTPPALTRYVVPASTCPTCPAW